MINTAVIGGSGYSGAELIQVLLQHPSVRITQVFAHSSAGSYVFESFPRFRKLFDARYELYSPEKLGDADLIFLSLPSGEAMKIVPALIDRGKKVIDLSGDFRLSSPKVYEEFYGHPHTASALLAEAIYGLSEFNRKEIADARLIANPGCYPTSILIPLIPVLRERLVEPNAISITSVSGTSGAGRSNTLELSFSEVNENFRAYKVGVHQHIPEIEAGLKRFGNCDATITFIPHLAPLTRGIHTTIVAPVRQRVNEQTLAEIYHSWFGNEPFIRLLGTEQPELRNVTKTNFCDIGFRVDPTSQRLVLFSVIDNLIKGAAGQAVQNMNIAFGMEETEGLL